MQVLPLEVTSVDLLNEVLEEELACWRGRLYWDYGPAVEQIRRHVAAHSLPGFVLSEEGRHVGYCYYVIAPPLGYLGSVYVRSEWASEANYRALLSKCWEALRSDQSIKRIECQIFGFNYDVCPVMVDLGFTALRRHFMTLRIRTLPPASADSAAPADFRVIPWGRGYFLPVAEAISASYRDSIDREMCYDYQSKEGCVRFLRNLVDNPGCGRFSPDTSLIALDSVGRVCGVLVTSVISEGTGMIPQISVRPDSQGKGLGAYMMRRYFAAARNNRLARITLSVSEQNWRAHNLYKRLGFKETKAFYAFVWNGLGGNAY